MSIKRIEENEDCAHHHPNPAMTHTSGYTARPLAALVNARLALDEAVDDIDRQSKVAIDLIRALEGAYQALLRDAEGIADRDGYSHPAAVQSRHACNRARKALLNARRQMAVLTSTEEGQADG